MRPQRLSPAASRRRGNVLVLTACFMVAFMALLAFAIDIGYLEVARVELQRTADASAMAAAWDLMQSPSSADTGMTAEIGKARSTAVTYAAANRVLKTAPIINSNISNSPDGDVVIGYLANPFSASASIDPTQLSRSNAAKVTVRRTSASGNGEVPLFFARVLGLSSQATQASATASLLSNFGGFQTPSDGSNLEILPFALDKQTWDAMLDGGGDDQWHWDAERGMVASGSDGVREVNLYPQGTGSPGNRGTVDIGSSNNSTADISRQILNGVNATDMAHFPDGKLSFDSEGHLYLNGDTGISAGVKDELTSIVGKPRIIPIFDEVSGPGNNAMYQIVEFAGVRLLDVQLTGKMTSKHVTIQPANIKTLGGIPSTSARQSWYIYSPVLLNR